MGYSVNLCELMKENGISSYRLAKEIGVHVSTVSNWRNGVVPKIDHLRLVASYFGVTTDALLQDHETKK